jgi:sortase A
MNRTLTEPARRYGGKGFIIGAALLLVLAGLAVAGVWLLGGPANREQGQAPAASAAQATTPAENTPQRAQAIINIETPSPYVVVKPEDLLPNPAASETVPVPTAVPTNTSTPAPAQAETPPAVATPAKAAPKKASGPLILPNGVRYGDHKPNLPGRIVRIASPNIKLDTSVYEVYVAKNQWEVADYAAGHNYNSKNPGEGGNIVLSGHNNWRGEVFRYLEFLKPGNEIDVWTLEGKEYKYQVQDIKKLKEAGASLAQRLSNGKVMDPTPYEQLTLITCWPYTTYTHRLIVTAKPIE